MKKIICLSFILLCTNIFAVETWLSAEYQYGFSFNTEKNEILNNSNGKNYTWNLSQHKINLKSYLFWNKKNAGLFLKLAFTLPSIDKQHSLDFGVQNISIPLSFGVGAGFKHSISDKGHIHYAFALGIDFTKSYGKLFHISNVGGYSRTDSNISMINFNILTDLGYKHSLVNNIFLDFGLNCSFKLAKYNAKNNKYYLDDKYTHSEKKSKWSEHFFGISILPYIGIGFTF